MVEVVVIGAGAIGAAVAARLGGAGARVALVDERAPGGGTSSATLAWINAVEGHATVTRVPAGRCAALTAGQPREYFELRLATMREHIAAERELGADWLRRSGSLEWAAEEAGLAALAAKVDRLRAWGYAAERLAPADVGRLERGLGVARADVPWVAHFPEDAWAQPQRLVRAFVEAAADAGVALHTGRRVTAVGVTDGRVEGVVLDGAERLPADVVVNCAGPDAAAVADLMGTTLPLDRQPGLVLTTSPSRATVTHVVRTPGIALRPEGGGRIFVSAVFAEVADGAPPPSPHAAVTREALRRARRILPALTDAQVERVCVGVRPVPPDGLPLVGWVAEGGYVAVTHSGITLAPLLGRLVAEEVVSGRPGRRLAPFRPDRLTTPGASGGACDRR